MKDQLRLGLSAARARFTPVLSYLRAHRFWVECASVSLFGVLAAFSVGYAAMGRTAALETRAAALARADQSLGRWRTEFQPPSPEESAAWRDSETTLLSLHGESARALSVARLVAQRAREVGLTSLRVRLLPTDSLSPLNTMEIAGWTVEPAGEGLSVEFDGNIGDLVGLLGALPPQAAVERVEMEPAGEALHARIVLATRRLVRRE
ncbi:MAG: hypothetical protein KY464_03995 [Gemmatimonadetes bacterium]|nr:hypothetical protein [Gemmatimonadota bacterium]